MAMWISCWVQFSEKLARREKALSTFSDKSLQAALPRSVGPVTRLARVLIRQWNPFRPRPTLPQRQCAKDMRMSRPWSGNGLLNRCWLVSVLGWSRELLSHCSFSESRNPARASPATQRSAVVLRNWLCAGVETQALVGTFCSRNRRNSDRSSSADTLIQVQHQLWQERLDGASGQDFPSLLDDNASVDCRRHCRALPCKRHPRPVHPGGFAEFPVKPRV